MVEAIAEAEYQRRFAAAETGRGPFFFIKVNIPDSWASYRSGNGEGMWAIIDAETKAKYDREPRDGVFFAYMANACVYHPELNQEIADMTAGVRRPLEFEYRGRFRPVLAKAKLESLIGPEAAYGARDLSRIVH